MSFGSVFLVTNEPNIIKRERWPVLRARFQIRSSRRAMMRRRGEFAKCWRTSSNLPACSPGGKSPSELNFSQVFKCDERSMFGLDEEFKQTNSETAYKFKPR